MTAIMMVAGARKIQPAALCFATRDMPLFLEFTGDLTIGVMGFLRPGQAIISDCGAKAKVAFIEKYKLGKVVGKRKINYGSYYVAEFNLARLAQLDPEGTERYLLENGLDQKEFKAN